MNFHTTEDGSVEEVTKVCDECGEPDGRHSKDCYHSDCDEDDWAVHGCGPLGTEPDLT